MEIQLKPYTPANTNQQAIPRAVLLRGASVAEWLRVMQELQLTPETVTAYALPAATGTAVWGCLFVSGNRFAERVPGRHEYCQCLHGLLFIPEQATVVPYLSGTELDHLLVSRPHFLHPETGLIELVKPVGWHDVICLPVRSPAQSVRPAKPVLIPERVISFQVQPMAADDVLTQLDRQLTIERAELPDKPLTTAEKIKLWCLQQLLGKPDNRRVDGVAGTAKKWLPVRDGTVDKTVEKLTADLEALEERNKKQLDRLLDMCRTNPEEALRFAIPLDPLNTVRGSQLSEFKLSPQWMWLAGGSWGGRSAGGGSILLPDDSYYSLQQQYRQMAKDLINKGDYQKAAFVYLKLLKDYPAAARTLENAKHYAEAASIWLKHVNDKEKAAECYEKARMYQAAIDLYLNLHDHRKLGDLYTQLNRIADARRHYQEVVNGLIRQQQYLQAADVYTHTLLDPARAQETRLEGWKKQADAFNCLLHYISHIPGAKQKYEAMQAIYREDVHDRSFRDYLHVLRSVYGHDPAWQEAYAGLAHALIVRFYPKHPDLISELRFFDSNNRLLLKDILRFKNNQAPAFGPS